MERANSRELIEHYDPFSEELHRNLASMYHALRNDCPVHKFERFEYPLYTVTRHADVKDMLKDQALWSSRYGQAPMYIEENGLVSDAPMHDMYRRMLNPDLHHAPRQCLEGKDRDDGRSTDRQLHTVRTR